MRPSALLLLAAGCAATPGPASPPPPAAAEPAPAPPPPAPTPYQGLGLESVPPEVLAKHAARPLPPAVSAKIQAMLDLRAPYPGVVSPDGRRLYFAWSITGVLQIFRLDAPMGFPTQLTGGEDMTTIAGLTPDGRWLIVQRDRAGEENPGLYLLSPEGGPLVEIQHKPKVQTFLDHVAEDGTIFFRANDVTPDAYALYRYDLATRTRTLVFSAPGIYSVADAREVGGKVTTLLVAKSVGSNMNEYYELPVGGGELVPLFGQGEREDYVAMYGAGDEILVSTPKFGEFRRLYRFERRAKEPFTPVGDDRAEDLDGFTIDKPRARIYLTYNKKGYFTLELLDAKTKKKLPAPPLPAADHTYLGAVSRDGRYATFLVDPGVRPQESYVFDFKTNKLTAWHRPASPEIDLSTFVRAELSSYPAKDGTAIPLFVWRPAACKGDDGPPCPVIVSFHGGPEAQARPGFNPRTQLFLDAGFVWVEPNVRGSDGYGKTWIHADDGKKRLDIISDIEDAGLYVKKAFARGGQAPRVGVFGGSYGGYSVLMAMTRFAGTYDAGVSVVGISSLLTFLENTAPYRRILRISEYGDPEQDRDALLALSPTTHIDRLAAPLLLVQGATDPRVPVGEALQFQSALERKGVPSELIVFPDEGHGMRKRPNQVLAIGHTLRFFQRHLAGAP